MTRFNVGVLSLANPVGYVGFSVWLIALGVKFLRQGVADSKELARFIDSMAAK